MYNHQVFNSIDDFMSAFRNGTLKRLPQRPDQDPAAGEWSTRKRPEVPAQRDLDHLPGPRTVSFGGLRFRVDRERQYTSWMGWGMYFGFDRDMGLSLWDIRFRGERIIYEVGTLCFSCLSCTSVLTRVSMYSSPHRKLLRSMVSLCTF